MKLELDREHEEGSNKGGKQMQILHTLTEERGVLVGLLC